MLRYFCISESWSDETISLRDVAVGHLAIGCGVSLRGKPLPFFVLLPTVIYINVGFSIIQICHDDDTKFGEVGAQFAELERGTTA